MSRPKALVVILACHATAGCGPATEPVTLSFSAVYGDAPIACTQPAGPVEMTDLRFYVSEAMLIGSNGTPVAIEFIEDDRWQTAGIALIDLEDGAGSCANGTVAENAQIAGRVPRGDYAGLGFTIGVPFDRNHSDPLTAPAPLDDAAMHWHWRAGYKFFRAGVRSAGDGYWIHLGSAGCEGTVQHITGCRLPNRARVTLADFTPGDVIHVDLAPLAGDLGDGAPADCSSGPAETACETGFAALGLEFGSDAATATQRVFRRGAP